MLYLLQINLCWAVFYGLYWLMYRQETFFRVNRFFLLFALLLGLVLPMDFAKYFLQPIDNQSIMTVYLETFVVGTKQTSEKIEHFSLDYKNVLWLVYALGCAVVLLRFLFGLKKLYTLYTHGEKEKKSGYILVKTDEIHLPFSFMNLIFWSQHIDNEEVENRRILLHEIAHVRQRHSFDVLVLELLNIVFWCSPLLYLYKKSLRAVHEYLADEAATLNCSKREYGTLLIRQSQSGMQLAIANSFIHSQLKQRFVMMLKPSSSRIAYVKYALFLPLMIVISCSLHENNTVAEPRMADYEVRTSVDTIITFDPETFKEDMKLIQNVDSIYNSLDTPAEFKGGQTELFKFLSANLEYPEAEKKAGIEGKVSLKFTVTKNGNVYDPKVIKSSGNSKLDQAAIDVLWAMDKGNEFNPIDARFHKKGIWNAGIKNGKPVSTDFVLPISFRKEK